MKNTGWTALAVLLLLAASLAPGRAEAARPAASFEGLVKVTDRGGLCPRGECSSEVVIGRDGRWVWKDGRSALREGRLSARELSSLKAAVRKTDFEAVMARRFSGTCPTAFDGQERTYAFNAPQGAVAIPSCTYDVDPALPVFRLLNDLLTKIRLRSAAR
ncbi:MAG: hypothetical protein WC969_09510 [Elusimicrobiota bacterium]|jgi:hypothetical protein